MNYFHFIKVTTLLYRMLSKNPEDRPNVKEILNTKIMEVVY